MGLEIREDEREIYYIRVYVDRDMVFRLTLSRNTHLYQTSTRSRWVYRSLHSHHGPQVHSCLRTRLCFGLV